MCFIFRTLPIIFPLFSLFPHPPFFSQPSLFSLVPGRVAFFILEEPTCLPTHQTHPRRASVLNSKVKTHYRAISPLIMLSNDLISLSVSPVSHRRLCRLGRPCPRVPAALRHHRHRRLHLVSVCPHQKQDRTLSL